MPFSSGVYTLPNPALVTGEVVSATENNTTRNDIAGAFNLTMLRNGTSTATANLPMGGYKLTGLGAPSMNGDSLAYGAAAVVSNLTDSALTITRVPYVSTGGLLVDSANFTFDGTTLTAGGFSTSGNISAATATVSGNITVSGGTANGVAYLNGSKVLTAGSALTFDGTSLTAGAGGTGTNDAFIIANSGSSASGEAAFALQRNSANQFLLYTDGIENRFWGQTNIPQTFYINNSEQMRLTSTGLGIGTSSPGYKLTVQYDAAVFAGSCNILMSAQGGAYGSLGTTSNHKLVFATNNTERATLDTAGNLGLGVTPSAWASSFKVMETSGGSFVGNTNGLANYITQNAIYTTDWKYKTNSQAAMYSQVLGQHQWNTAPSGTAGNAISFTQAMTLDASGNLGIGTSSPSNHLDVIGSGAQTIRVGSTNGDVANLSMFSNGNATWSLSSDTVMRFKKDSTEYMRINSSGNVGIGTSSPQAKLDVSGSVKVASSGYLTWDASANWFIQSDTANWLRFATNGSERMRIDSSGNVGIGTSSPATNFQIDKATQNVVRLTSGTAATDLIATASGDGQLRTVGAHPLIFGTNATERMRIDSSGNLLVGTTSNVPGNPRIGLLAQSGVTAMGVRVQVNGNGAFEFFNASASQVGSIIVNSASTAYNTSSDYRLKENIQPMQNALGVVAQLNPVTYTWKADGSDGQGFIAHELQAVVPDCVTGEKDAVDAEGNPVYQGIDTSFLVATLTKAIQEQQEQINQLKAEVATLKGN